MQASAQACGTQMSSEAGVFCLTAAGMAYLQVVALVCSLSGAWRCWWVDRQTACGVCMCPLHSHALLSRLSQELQEGPTVDAVVAVAGWMYAGFGCIVLQQVSYLSYHTSAMVPCTPQCTGAWAFANGPSYASAGPQPLSAPVWASVSGWGWDAVRQEGAVLHVIGQPIGGEKPVVPSLLWLEAAPVGFLQGALYLCHES